jgi:hypothetical protein
MPLNDKKCAVKSDMKVLLKIKKNILVINEDEMEYFRVVENYSEY